MAIERDRQLADRGFLEDFRQRKSFSKSLLDAQQEFGDQKRVSPQIEEVVGNANAGVSKDCFPNLNQLGFQRIFRLDGMAARRSGMIRNWQSCPIYFAVRQER